MTNIDEYEDEPEGWVYMFAVFVTEEIGHTRLVAECDEDMLLPAWLEAFVDLNEERLCELLERSCKTWGKGWKITEDIVPYLQCFWEEDDDFVLCKSTACAEEFEERLPIPRGIPFKDKAAHKRFGLDVEE